MASLKGQRWIVDSGILRKKNTNQNPINQEDGESEDLLVFGYTCKLFRDDEKARMIDQGKHLIPWMADNTLRIDRYDGRGALADLKTHEPPPGGFDQRTIFTEEELRIEQLCDEERYRSLTNNDNQEEEIKRLHRALDSTDNDYGQVGYNYDDENRNNQEETAKEVPEEDLQAFVPPPELDIPQDMSLPDTEKLNAIITKTALFISRQGGQMEILIKAKQANNPQFSFLSIDSLLHPYYRLVLDSIKNGTYNPEKQSNAKTEEGDEENEESDDEDSENYLHPSLASSFMKIEAAPSIPSIQYKPSADCAYSMLVNKITGKPPPAKIVPVYQHSSIPPPPPPPPTQYYHGPVIYNSNDGVPEEQIEGREEEEEDEEEKAEQDENEDGEEESTESLVPYGINPPLRKQLSRPSFIIPPVEVQIIIDKMASYVAKNGRDFEAIVKNKGDPRFNFLELSHQYYGYYAHKLNSNATGEIKSPMIILQEQQMKQKKLDELQKKQQRMEEVQKRVKMIQAKKKLQQQQQVVSFSIKKPKEGDSVVIEKRNALPMEESDEEEGGEEEEEQQQGQEQQEQEEDQQQEEGNKKDDDLVDLTNDVLSDLNDHDQTSFSNKQLQLERKKRAAAFLSQIQTNANKESDIGNNSSIPSPPSPPKITADEKNSLMSRLKAADFTSSKRTRTERSRSGSRQRDSKVLKKHKKKKTSKRSLRESPTRLKSHKRKSKKSSTTTSKHKYYHRHRHHHHHHQSKRRKESARSSDSSSSSTDSEST